MACALGLGMVGCDDYLDITPPSQVTPETYFTNASQLGAYTIAYYDRGGQNGTRGANAFPHYGYSGSGYQFYIHDDMGTDNECGTSLGNEFYSGADYKVGNGTGGSWSFGTINDLNYFLETVVPKYAAGQITGDKVQIEHYIGEGYMLRAIEYYKKLRAMGDFPIITKNLPMVKDSLINYSKRAPRNQVARFILADLDSAIKYLSDGSTTGGKNRITRDIAYLEKARVALYEGTFEKYFAGTPFVPDKAAGWPGAQKEYNANYSYDNASEVNFFLTEALNASKFVADKYPTLTANNKKVLGATYTNMPVNPYYAMFTSQNLSSYESEVLMWRSYNIDISGGHSLGQYMKSNNGFTQEFANTFLMANGLPIYDANSGYAGDDFVQDTKKGRDYRWQIFTKAPNEYVFEGDSEQKIGIGQKRSSTDYLVPGIVSAPYCGSTTGYQKAKGFTTNADWTKGGHDLTAPCIYRSVEAYLIYMEACWELKGDGLDADAWNYWNKIRTRAGVADAQVTIAATDLEKEEYTSHDLGLYSAGSRITSKVLYNIRRERRCELMSEGFRMDDLKRWRSFDQLIENPIYLHGCKIFGPMKEYYPTGSGSLKYDQSNISDNNVSSPTDVEGGFETALGVKDPRYFSLFRINTNNKFYDTGMSWKMAHYLEPINRGHFLESCQDGVTIEDSPIYQNPYWPTEGDQPALQ